LARRLFLRCLFNCLRVFSFFDDSAVSSFNFRCRYLVQVLKPSDYYSTGIAVKKDMSLSSTNLYPVNDKIFAGNFYFPACKDKTGAIKG